MPETAGASQISFIPPRLRTILLAVLVGAIIAPALYYRMPWFVHSPDIYYLKAKVLWVMQGHIFVDPITGYDTFHPPFYYIVLAGFTSLGLDLDFLLVLITLANVILILTLSYKIVARVFGRETAFVTILLIMFIIEFMGSRNILLASSFYFSLPFYLVGLWFYITGGRSWGRAGAASFFWGMAFLISPVYLFLIGLTFVRDVINFKSWRRILIMAGCFLLVMPLFLYQAYIIYSGGLNHTSTFSFWRGVPGLSWFGDLIVEFLSPSLHNVTSFPAVISLLIIILALIAITRNRRAHWFNPVAAAAFVLTFYHFSGQYAIRIQLLLSIFMVATAVDFVRRRRIKTLVWFIPAVMISLLSMYHFYAYGLEDYRRWDEGKAIYFEVREDLWQNLDKYLRRDDYIFSTKETYFQFIMTVFPVHALGAYKTLEYYQLDTLISNRLERDYQISMNSNDYNTILGVADKYKITTAVASQRDYDTPLFKTLSQNWPLVYRGKYFRIFQRP